MLTLTQKLQGGEKFPGEAATQSAEATDWYSHPVWCPWATQVEWEVYLGLPEGAPTSGGLEANFEIWTPNVSPNGTQTLLENSAWVPVSVNDMGSQMPAGDWPLFLAQFGLAAAVRISRLINTSARHRLHIHSTLAGGAKPGLPLSVRYMARG
jgi:hypothetical protein